MMKIELIGYIGNNAEIKTADGREFTTFRVANSERWKDDAGNVHDSTTWVDCVMDGKPNVVEYLKRGTLVFVSGSVKLRVYSSQKDRCMKAGLTINVRQVELLGGKSDPIPNQIVDDAGQLHEVKKWYHCADAVRGKKDPELVDVFNPKTMERYQVDRNGFIIIPTTNAEQTDETDSTQS